MSPLALDGTPPERRYCAWRRSLRKSAAASACGSVPGSSGIGLLGLGTLLVRLRPTSGRSESSAGAWRQPSWAFPTLISGLRGVVTGDTRRATDQLVAIAVLAAAATGDFVTATLIPLFLEVGRLFEERSSLGARAAIDGIRALGARQAVRWRNGVEERVDPNSLRPGDEILVRPGERIAVDGTVLEGRAAVDQSAITGESLHEDVGPGSPVFAGTVALDGLLKIQVRGAGADTVLGRVVQLLAEVERTSVPVLRLFERRAGCGCRWCSPWRPRTLVLHREIFRAPSPCSWSRRPRLWWSRARRRGGGDDRGHAASHPHQERRFSRARLRRRYVDPRQDRHRHRRRACRHAKSGRRRANPKRRSSPSRPRAASARCIRFRAPSWPKLWRAASWPRLPRISRSGRGSAWSPWSMASKPSSGAGRCSSISASVPVAEDDGDVSQVWVAYGGRCLGRLVLRDQPRSEAREALAAMRALGIDRLVLLTGDRAAVAREVGQVLGMDEVVAEVLPAQKLEVVRAEQAAGRTVMMVGDGVNDAPALGGADVGVAIGAELNEVALGGADVALLGTDLGRLPQLIGLADTTRRVIGQNVWLAFGLSVVLIALAAGGLLDPLTGALAKAWRSWPSSPTVLESSGSPAHVLRRQPQWFRTKPRSERLCEAQERGMPPPFIRFAEGRDDTTRS